MSKIYKPTILIAGDPNSIFFEIFFKALKYKKYKSPLILVASYTILKRNLKRYKISNKINLLNIKNLKNEKLNNNFINLINVNFDKKNKKFNERINLYIKESFDIGFKLIRSGFSDKLINGPINKKNFLKKKFLGITEYISNEFNSKKVGMLIYNKEISVCPITTHLPLKLVSQRINKNSISEKVFLIDSFYKKRFGFKPKIGVTGLNPHCESILKLNEDEKVTKPAIKNLKKKGYNINGPIPADTIFLKQNRQKFDVILGMYHDQVLAPVKTLKEYDAINITLGLPFLRISPDHGPNKKMINKNLSSPLSLIRAIEFLDRQ